MIKVEDLKQGDLVDLEGDVYADPENNNPMFTEYLEVENVEIETPECVLVYFEGFDAVGFPTGHTVTVKKPENTF